MTHACGHSPRRVSVVVSASHTCHMARSVRSSERLAQVNIRMSRNTRDALNAAAVERQTTVTALFLALVEDLTREPVDA